MGPHEIFRGIPTRAESQRTNEISPFLEPRALYKIEIMINTNGYHFLIPTMDFIYPTPHLIFTTVFELGIVFTFSDEETVARGIIVGP